MKKLFAVLALIVCFTICFAAFSEGIVVAFEKLEYSVLAGKAITVTPVIQGTNQYGKYSYTSADETIATVNNNGKVIGVSAGSTVISCSVIVGENTFECSYTIRVDQPVTEIVALQPEFVLPSMAAIRTPVVTVLPEDAANKELEFTSSNEAVGYAYDDGKIVAGRRGGTATITCKATDGSGVTAKFKITVPTVAWISVPTDITIDTPEGIVLYYFPTFGQSYNTANDYCSNDVIAEKYISLGFDERETELKKFLETQPFTISDAYRTFTKIQLVPQKVGKSKFIIEVNGRQGAINVTVARDAVYEALKYADYEKKASEGLRYSISGVVMGYEEGSNTTLYLAAENDEIYPVKVLLPKIIRTFAEGDLITVDGTFNSMTDYITETGLTKSIPEIAAERLFTSDGKDLLANPGN